MAEKSGVEQLMVEKSGVERSGVQPLICILQIFAIHCCGSLKDMYLAKKLPRNGQKEPLVSFEFRATALMKV